MERNLVDFVLDSIPQLIGAILFIVVLVAIGLAIFESALV